MKTMNWTKEIEEDFKKIIELKKKGSRINGNDITILYNLVFDRNLKPTNCGSCINQRYNELKDSYNKYNNSKLEALIAIDELMSDDSVDNNETKITTKRGRPKKE